MESEKDAVIRRARAYGKRHHGIINPDAEIMQEGKVEKNKKGVPTFNAQKVLDNQCARKNLLDDDGDAVGRSDNPPHRRVGTVINIGFSGEHQRIGNSTRHP
jgi:hypothetical protein